MSDQDALDPAHADADPDLRKDLRTLAWFIDIYCRHKHRTAPRNPAAYTGIDFAELMRRPPPQICDACAKLLAHAFVKRIHCPFDPKPACKHCPDHCYHPTYREQIRQVMKYSGRRLVLSGRLDLAFKLLF